MGNYEFDISAWLPQCPLTPTDGRYAAEIITGPSQICNNEQLRVEVSDQVDLGTPVPVDVFIMAEGEPSDRHVTKLGGLPYRPAGKPWPLTADGLPMIFLAQFCFADSQDLTGKLPADVLLVFTPCIDDRPEPLTFEWYDLGLTNLIAVAELPEHSQAFAPFFGHVFRTTSYPAAKRKAGIREDTYLKCRGLDVWSDHFLFQYQATQIGQGPFYIQADPRLPGRPLCVINSVCPEFYKPFPWINRREPLYAPGEWRGWDDQWLLFGDAGCLYISYDDDGRLYSVMDCY
jgi:hypothetical protein